MHVFEHKGNNANEPHFCVEFRDSKVRERTTKD